MAAVALVAVLAQAQSLAPRVALYAGVGEELIAFGVDVNSATVARQS